MPMVTKCCCDGCDETYVDGGPVTFYNFPRDEKRAKIWLQNINRVDLVPTIFSKVCSKHFTEECFRRGMYGTIWLKRNAVPTVFDFSEYPPNHHQTGPKGRGRKRQATSLSGSSVPEDEIDTTIRGKYVPVLPAPPASANGEGNYRDLCILLPASPEPQQTWADDERSGNGTNPEGESDKVKRDSATNKMEWGVLTKKKSGQSHRGENHDYSVCLTVNLKDFFGSEAVPQGSSVGESRVVSGDDSCGSRVGQPATLLPPWYTHCHCTVYRCATNYHEIPSVTYHSLPKDERLRREWLARCGRSDKVNMRHATVCSVHFGPEDYERDLMNELLGLPLRKKLIPTAVPTLNLPSPQEDDITECTKECKYTSVKQEPVEDLDKPSCSATEQVLRDPLDVGESSVHVKQEHELKNHMDGCEQNECEYMFVKREPEGDLDKAICSANEEFLEDPGLYIKQDPELNLDVDGPDNNEFQYIEVKEEPPEVEATQCVW